jgi:hypothetical protein
MKNAVLNGKKMVGNFSTKYILSYVFIVAVCSSVFSQNLLKLNDSKLYYAINSPLIEVFEDSQNQFNTVASIQSKIFKSTDFSYFSSRHPSSTYWGRFLITDQTSIDKHWFFVSYNYSIDSLDLYVYKKAHMLFHKQYRLDSPDLTTKEILYKHFTVDFPIPQNDTLIVYIKLWFCSR